MTNYITEKNSFNNNYLIEHHSQNAEIDIKSKMKQTASTSHAEETDDDNN